MSKTRTWFTAQVYGSASTLRHLKAAYRLRVTHQMLSMPVDSRVTDATPTRAFVPPHSIVRKIWGDPDLILLIFAGAAAEFALNRAVDWLFFTGKIPGDPIGRLFSTVSYAQDIVFVDNETAERTLKQINAAHRAVERQRIQTIPAWAFRDVLYM